MLRFSHILIVITVFFVFCTVAFGLERFPPPDFEETNYKMPTTDQITDVTPRAEVFQYLDVVVLAGALLLSSYLTLKKRSRRSIFILMIFSLLYFGFWREGCICPIGAIQNFVLSIFDNSYALSVSVLAFFILPLVFTLFFGRTFCSAVCPLGAIQDLVLLRPVQVAPWLEGGLRLLAYIYLGAAVLLAATGSAFIICRYDPFVSFFRITGHMSLLVLGICFLLIGMFVGRPYCRFICPYGIILRQLSKLSKWKVTITPDECIKCRLCRSKKLLGFLLLLLPVFLFLGGWAGSGLSWSWSRMHPTVRLAERIYMENEGQVTDTIDASTAFRATGKPTIELYDEASAIRNQMRYGGWIFGCFVGMVAGLKLIMPSIRKQRTEFEADKGGCLSCGRCFKFCPKEHVKLKE
ncbi:MAG: 4Fe-4S binding protein [Planctomycetota bacterium]